MNGISKIKCPKCERLQLPDAFPILTRGAQTGQRAKTCGICLETSRAYKKARKEDKENIDIAKNRTKYEPLEKTCYLREFLSILMSRKNIVEIETLLDASDDRENLRLEEHRGRADKIAESISGAMGYLFRYHSSLARINQSRYVYHCAQNIGRQKQCEKVPDPKKQRDKSLMAGFDCDGWLYITIAHDKWEVGVKLRHKNDHIPYCAIALPEDVKVLIRNRYRESVTQLWDDILKIYPTPQFTRRAVYYLWSKLNETEWKRNPDQIISAKELLQEVKMKSEQCNQYRAELIELPVEEGFTALAWCLPDMLVRWSGRIREVALDSAWETNGSKFELYSLLGEAYGTGLPLGFCLLHSEGGAPGGIERHLTSFLKYFTEKWALKPIVGLSDKNISEINSMTSTLSSQKHQLCLWHCLRAVKKRLSILRRTPAFYNVDLAYEEYPWIDRHFLPVSQLKGITTNLYVAERTIPTLTIRLNGKPCTLPAPGRECLKIRITPLTNSTNRTTDVSPEPSKIPSHHISEDGVGNLSDDEDGEFGSILESSEIHADGNETDDEDGPDWMFDIGETVAEDPAYIFCPAAHRHQLLRIYTKHFCQHPIFPDENGYHSATEIRNNAVREMYQFCYARGLREVWAYFWTSWYQPKMWTLWSRSSSSYLPRWRTTMSVENFWRQLKHDYLHHLLRPRIDQLVWIIQNKVVPNYMARAVYLEDVYRMGRSRKLTAFQIRLKKEWFRLANLPTSKRNYVTDIETWVCNCAALKYNSFHLCKHLVQGISTPPHDFFGQIIRRRTSPLYRHPILHPIDAPDAPWLDPDDGAITDGDDHVFLGDKSTLENGKWRSLLDSQTSLGKRRASIFSEASSDVGDSRITTPEPSQVSTPEEQEYGNNSDDEQELNSLREQAESQLNDWIESADIIKSQIKAGNLIWLRSFTTGLGKSVQTFRKTIRQVEVSGRVRKTTWARNREESRTSRYSMGYQIRDEFVKNV